MSRPYIPACPTTATCSMRRCYTPRRVGTCCRSTVGPNIPDPCSASVGRTKPHATRNRSRHGSPVRIAGSRYTSGAPGRSCSTSTSRISCPAEPFRAVKSCDPPYQSTRVDTTRPWSLRLRGAGRHGRQLWRRPRHLSWGEVRGQNGIIVVEPTEHEKAAQGGQYRWQRTGTAPRLPDELAACLRPPGGRVDELDDATVKAWLSALPIGPVTGRVAEVPIDYPAKGRHPLMLERVLRLVRLASRATRG